MATTFTKKSTKKVPPSKKRKFPVYVVIRHTRAGDQRIHVYDDKGPESSSRSNAMSHAEDVANEAAMHYGHGSASVFKGFLVLNEDAEQP